MCHDIIYMSSVSDKSRTHEQQYDIHICRIEYSYICHNEYIGNIDKKFICILLTLFYHLIIHINSVSDKRRTHEHHYESVTIEEIILILILTSIKKEKIVNQRSL